MNNMIYALLSILVLASCTSTQDDSYCACGPAEKLPPQYEQIENMFNTILNSDAGFYCGGNIEGLEASIVLRKIWSSGKPRAKTVSEFIKDVKKYNSSSPTPIFVRDEKTGRKQSIAIWLRKNFQ